MKKKRTNTTTGYGQVTTCLTIVTGYGQGAPCPNTAANHIKININNNIKNQIITLRSVTSEMAAVFFKHTSPHPQDQAPVIPSSHHGEERSDVAIRHMYAPGLLHAVRKDGEGQIRNDEYARAAIREAQTKPKTAASNAIHKSTEIKNTTLRSVTNRMAAVFFKHTACRLQYL
jgi:hypothetical protein